MSDKEKFDAIIKRADDRNYYYKLLNKLIANCHLRDIPVILENPFSPLHYLHNNFLAEPAFIDKDRTRRGDYFKKPTGFWFFGCSPTHGMSYQSPKKRLVVFKSKSSSKAGLCSEERSMIHPDYARNFICDFILGKPQNGTQLNLFEQVGDNQ